MDEKLFLLFMKIYFQFKENFEKKLRQQQNIIETEGCYIIDNNWFNILLFYYKSYNNNKKYKLKSNNKNNYFPNEEPIYIQNIFELNNKYIKTKKKFTIINAKIMEILNKNLNDKTTFIIY